MSLPGSNRAKAAPPLAPLIAVVGCDGAGKSTLSVDLAEWLARCRPAGNAYLGLRSADIGNRIKRWPIVGVRFEAYLARKASQARNRERKIPGLPTALVIYLLSMVRQYRFSRVLVRRREGVAIVTDRYPQTDVPGFYDGPGLSAARAEGAAVRWLARREFGMYAAMTTYNPDLVIRLNIDLETAAARRPDDKRSSLAAKIAVTPQLRFNGAEIVDLSALDPYEVVLANAKRAIREKMAALGQPVPPPA